MKITKTEIKLESRIMPSFSGFWTKWIAKSGKHKVEERTAHKALSKLLKTIKWKQI